ncbi:isochorismatase family protein [Calditerrivibrio nitroreducens]|uniref:Isochorismatase hydrolase n=1 Tax=Calditerrivibrio nitroreducens (strain DSM 19672 / NBRC 101217 / Yu37-1) TaxID=768670 RepID=E4TJ71_CALNY|nr:isochorismatase family protein [Calditerrivibrio nitroreducens]ADR18107.1 isochorismatase hydrolase [Calditerrivibrio nitroreducens DSM 19672]
MFMPKRDNSGLLIIDVQENLVKAMNTDLYREKLSNMIKIAKFAKLINLPYFITQHYTKGLGNTVRELRDILGDDYFEKIYFSAYREPEFTDYLCDCRNIFIVGMEAHVCVLQTALDLLDADYNVFVVEDAVLSTKKDCWQNALEYLKIAGGIITNTETVIFQLLEKGGTEEFKEALKIIKDV